MRKILNLFIIALIAFSCGSNGNLNKSKGELVGVKGNKYFAEKPFGMVLVPGGSFITVSYTHLTLPTIPGV